MVDEDNRKREVTGGIIKQSPTQLSRGGGR